MHSRMSVRPPIMWFQYHCFLSSSLFSDSHRVFCVPRVELLLSPDQVTRWAQTSIILSYFRPCACVWFLNTIQRQMLKARRHLQHELNLVLAQSRIGLVTLWSSLPQHEWIQKQNEVKWKWLDRKKKKTRKGKKFCFAWFYFANPLQRNLLLFKISSRNNFQSFW